MKKGQHPVGRSVDRPVWRRRGAKTRTRQTCRCNRRACSQGRCESRTQGREGRSQKELLDLNSATDKGWPRCLRLAEAKADHHQGPSLGGRMNWSPRRF